MPTDHNTDAFIDEAELEGLLLELIAIPSVNPMGRAGAELPAGAGEPEAIARFVHRWLLDRGIPAVLLPVPSGGANVVATLGAEGDAPTLLFDAHTDTVPADDWLDTAFRPRREGNRIYGRGACDTKGSLAAMMVALAAANRSGPPPHRVVLLASADEEYGRTGLRTYLAEHPRIDAAVVGEPTGAMPIIACKGAARWDIVVNGRSAHTSRPHEGVNAITGMGRVLQTLELYQQEVLSTRISPLVGPPTLTVTTIRGGTACNMVPAQCRISLDLRTLPEEPPADAMRDVQQFLEARCRLPMVHESVQLWEGAITPADHPFVDCCRAICQEVHGPEQGVACGGVSYGCHASDYSRRRIPNVIIGPGNIAQAHTADEFVPFQEVLAACRVYRRLMTGPLIWTGGK